MIITDNALAPSKRFIEIVAFYFVGKGFAYNKTKKCFQKMHEDRVENVYPTFINRSGLVDVDIRFTLTFPQVWSIYKRLTNSKHRPVQDTVGTSLLNYPHSARPHLSINLHEPVTGKYDDFTLNNAAEKFIAMFDLYVAPFFARVSGLKQLDLELNSLPITRTYLCSPEAHFEIGLIISKLLDPDNLEHLFKSYTTYYNDSRYYNKEEILEKLLETKNILLT